jgi:hypothetical protein
MLCGMDYDTSRLVALGKARRALVRKLADNRAELNPEVVAALRAGVPQARVAEMSGLTREWVRRLTGEKP